jgi:outer membrane protein OmpA-like peptidoglycan-associated protein
MSCVSPEKSTRPLAETDLAIYRKTDDQAGHELVKTAQFLVPKGSSVVIKGLEFEPGTSTLTLTQKQILQQVFNCLEEITENTVGDTNSARVAEFKKMKFEVCGYSEPGGVEMNKALPKQRAEAVRDRLTYLGTPGWRLKATARGCDAVKFIRTR